MKSIKSDQSPEGPKEYKVKGTVYLADGSPAAGMTIRAFDRDLRSEEPLGQSPTDKKGFYQIQYSSNQFRNREKGSVDLVVKAFSDKDAVLAVSPVLFNAPASADIDLTIKAETVRPPSLFEKIGSELKPLLEGSKVKVNELEEDGQHQDLSFLSGETGFGKSVLSRFILAHKMAEQAIEPEFWFALLGGSFFQFNENQSLKNQHIALLDSLPSLDVRSVRKSLTRAINQNDISETYRKKIDKWVEAFLKFVAGWVVSPPDKPTFIKLALEHARIKDAKKQGKFSRLFNEYKALTPELLRALEKNRSFSKAEIADLRTTFRLVELTQSDFSVVRMLKEQFKVREPGKIRTLAKQSEGEWVKLIKAKHRAGEIKLPLDVNKVVGKMKFPAAELYGKMLEKRFREAFPTAAFTGGLERAISNGGAKGLKHADKLRRFLRKHEEFEFLNTPIEEFLKTKLSRDLAALGKDEQFKLELKAVQRVFKLTMNYEAMDILLADHMHSAQKVYRMGETEFVRNYSNKPGFNPENAHLVWRRAADTHAAVMTIVGDLNSLEATGMPIALRTGNEVVSNFPNWNNLFKTGDLCECEHCKSVLGPAAYFTDLLMFLKDRKAKDQTVTVKDILFSRRPDLGFLELNCENALTTIPYVDVVCEVLERAIDRSGDNDLILTGFTMPVDEAARTGCVVNALKAAFTDLANDGKEKVDPGNNISLSQVDPSDANRWVVHGDNATYLLKKNGNAVFFAELQPNTKASAAELRAYPQYVNPKAYEKLRSAKYPQALPLDLFPEGDSKRSEQRERSFALPFDLFAEEVRAGFKKCNLQRWDLMRTLRGAATPNNPSEGEIAAEYFGISAGFKPEDPSANFDEKSLILKTDDATVARQKVIWGVTGPTWLNRLRNVKNFLQKTGLEYNELLALLDLKSINSTVNPINTDPIQHQDASCDTDKKYIKVLDVPKLDRIHRFLRMWRKLNGWKMWELDQVIRHPRIGNGKLNEEFLINLFYFCEVKKKLGGKTTVEQTCALFGDLNTETHFTKLYEKREDALYQSLFLNKKLINPIDTAFQIDAATNDLPAGETITAYHSAILAALGIKEADLVFLKALTKTNGDPYIPETDDLNLANLSFLWRHTWLAKMLKYKAEEWKTLLKSFNNDIAEFASPQVAWDFLEQMELLKKTGFSVDEVNWLLAADRTAKAAVKETDAARFLVGLRKDLQTIQAEYDPSQYDFLTSGLPSDDDRLIVLLTSLLQKLNRNEEEINFFLATLRECVQLPVNLHAIKFYEPIFIVPLDELPPAVDFKLQLPVDLAMKISYDAEQHFLRFAGIMSSDEQSKLDSLVGNVLPSEVAYHNAVDSLATQQLSIAPPDERIWLTNNDLDATQPANDTLAKRLANAAQKALVYLSKTLVANMVVQQCSAQLGLTAALTRRLLADYAVQLQPAPAPKESLLKYLTDIFAVTSSVVDYAAQKTTFDGWYWANRVAAIWKKWKITLAEMNKIISLTAGAQLLDFETLPLNNSGVVASLERFLRTNRLIRLRDSLPETKTTLLEVLAKLNNGVYAAEAASNPPTIAQQLFAGEVERLNEAWRTTDVEQLIESLDLAYPDKYLLAESWERLRRAFYFLDNLNGSADTAKKFAAAAMTVDHAKSLKELLRSKFGTETWLTLCAEIQDALRERKRDALAAYLLTHSKLADAPSGKWENTNDLYAYYLLDVEMNSCQMTSRLVQASGSVQLFVQRCFMGLEPNVAVKADGDDGDSAWRWWKWMRKYRVWEANRKVFLWPENWIEPELKKDRSQFFKDMENELLQNEINQYTAETAFQNYLEKLDGVAQIEIGGFYQEDDGDNTILHVFGRTAGAEPHLYYYRRYDYRQWTPWEKVDLDIQGDYLIPAVLNKRMFLFWPVFTEVSDDAENKITTIPQSGDPVKETMKKLRLQMAVSEYRQGKWSPKKVSKDSIEWRGYRGEIDTSIFGFTAIDRSTIDGKFGLSYGLARSAEAYGYFEVFGCAGSPEKSDGFPNVLLRQMYIPDDSDSKFMRYIERARSASSQGDLDDDLSLWQTYFLGDFESQDSRFYLLPTLTLETTPGLFKVSLARQLSYFDKLLLGDFPTDITKRYIFVNPAGSWLPFFYRDNKHTYFVLPMKWNGHEKDYYPAMKKLCCQLEKDYESDLLTRLNATDYMALPDSIKDKLARRLENLYPGISRPSTNEEFRSLLKRYNMDKFRFLQGAMSLSLDYVNPWRRFHFRMFYHPFICDFSKIVSNPMKGLAGLMRRETQLQTTEVSFFNTYKPTAWVLEETGDPQNPDSEFYPKEDVDFRPDGAYAPYNWELFFHAPLMIANQLSKNQRFEEARDWYHFIFNPIGVESPLQGGSPMSKYWITKPFYETSDPLYIQQRIDNILRMLAGDTNLPGYSEQAKKDLEDQVLDWRTNPFEPHRIANYRTVAYQKTVVMKYLDNLIAWGDYLFRQDSMESINEATQLYILAAEILGPRPKRIPPQGKPPLESFNELEYKFEQGLNRFGNPLVEVENLVPVMPGTGQNDGDVAPLPILYFCVPQNDKMLGYWDTIADRLYKIRHCMNIEGVVRQLALFEPPIDPGALVKAVAAGVDISSALADLNAPLPLYRFNVSLQKANEVCNDVKALGGALLAALEKKDAEALSLLRQGHEIRVLEAVKAVREKQIEEAKENLEGVKRSKAIVEERRNFYRDVEKVSNWETASMVTHGLGVVSEIVATVLNATAGVAHLVPEITVGASGFGGSPHVTVKYGGQNVGESAFNWAAFFSGLGGTLHSGANLMATQASNERRWQEWKLQERLADKELLQIDTQIATADLRVKIAEKELENHLLQIENAKAIDELMHSKYTNQELYQWQVGQISGVYFQSYKLAYDLAKRAERCFRFEMGLQDSKYINFGYWDSLKKGLLSGEKLQYDLRRLETGYLEQSRREFELTKHISLVLLDPLALVKLRETGRCFFNLPEEIFDLDYPGHYFRRIKSVSLTLPCVTGPYTTISCTLRLLNSSIRINTTNGENGFPRNIDDAGLPVDDPRFVENNIPVKAIAASSGQNDSGVFELSFRDDRYLPFEGGGVISEWSLELFNDSNDDFGRPLRQFDYNTISDAILHIKYTAREDVGAFKNGAVNNLRNYFSKDGTTPSLRMFNLRQEFPTQWHRFLHPTDPTKGNVFELEMVPGLFPFRDLGKALKVNTIWLLARFTDSGNYNITMTPPFPKPVPPNPDPNMMTLTPVNEYGGLHFRQKEVGIAIDQPVKWQITMTNPDPANQLMEVEDFLLVLGYQWV